MVAPAVSYRHYGNKRKAKHRFCCLRPIKVILSAVALFLILIILIGNMLFLSEQMYPFDPFLETLLVSSSSSNKPSSSPPTLSRTILYHESPITPDQMQDRPITPRTFPIYPHPLPCYLDQDPDSKDEGFIYIKLQKCASSTIRKILLALTAKYGRKHHLLLDKERNSKNYQKCKSHHRHGFAFRLLPKLTNRKKDRSFLFTFIREPTDRFISDFYYHGVSKSHTFNVDDGPSVLKGFRQFVREKVGGFPGYGGYMFPYLLTEEEFVPPISPDNLFWDPLVPALVQNPSLLQTRVEGIMSDYDFIGVTSRMDESLVALALILQLPLVDTLPPLVTVRSRGTFDYDRSNNKCFLIQKASSPTMEMREYLKSPEWKAQISGDALLYSAANASLDRTIEMIGRKEFSDQLGKYVELKEAVFKVCGGAECTRCSVTGEVLEVSNRSPRCDMSNCLKVALKTLEVGKNGSNEIRDT